MTVSLPSFDDIIAEYNAVPLSWAGGTMNMDYINLGDALSPVMVALCTGRSVRRVPFRSLTPRMSAVGTIGHGLNGGEVRVWGTGCSPYVKPKLPVEERVPYTPPPETDLIVSATRGPLSWQLLTGTPSGRSSTFGDPVWLLPRFYPDVAPKRWDLGVILHLSELSDRALEAHPLPQMVRYDIEDRDRANVRLINTVSAIGADGLRNKLDEILSCRRIVSTSLHGMVIAESYGIPCLYFPPHGHTEGLDHVEVDIGSGLDLRILDFYQGVGVRQLPIYVQERDIPTDWEAVIRAIDAAWTPITMDEDPLWEALPVQPRPLHPRIDETVFEHPLIAGLQFQHDVRELNREDRIAARKRLRAAGIVVPALPPSHKPESTVPLAPIGDFQAVANKADGVPLSWVMPTVQHPYPNVGDALSAVMVGTIAGRPVIGEQFDAASERMAAVGTIAHGLRNGRIHLWGVGLDASKFSELPPGTELVVHATRGPHTAALLREKGVQVPDIFGDPVWFLPKMYPRKSALVRWELGVVVHISELDGSSPQSLVRDTLRRYAIPDEFRTSIKIINTYCDNSTEGLMKKVDEILSCRRIAATSFHGLLIADAYGIPGVWFGTEGKGPAVIDTADPDAPMDHRFRDFYAGCRTTKRPIYRTERRKATDWQALIKWIDKAWSPPEVDPVPLFNSFPLATAVALHDDVWKVDYRTLTSFVPGRH